MKDLNVAFKSASNGRVVVQILSLDGQVVRTDEHDVTLGKNLITLDVSEIAAATYYVKIHNGSESFTEKFVKH